MSIQRLTTAMVNKREPSLQCRSNSRLLTSTNAKASAVLLIALGLLAVLFFSTAQNAAFADTTSGNTTQISSSTASSSSITVTFDITTAAVVSFVLVLLGLAASLILVARYASPAEKIATDE